MTDDADEPVPLALQLAARVEKVDPPEVDDICRAAVLATIALLDDERSAAGGPWHDEVTAWNGSRIRKLVRRGRGAAWDRAQEPRGVTVAVGRAEVRAFVPGPMDDVPEAVAKLQIQSSALPEPDRTEAPVEGVGLVIAVTPEVEMSWGKQAAQCAHAGQRAWMTADPESRQVWDDLGRPVTIARPTRDGWPALVDAATTRINDGGYTEIPAGTLTAVAWWA